jgi:predicted small secreted protein
MISKRIWLNSSGVYNMVKSIFVVAALATTMLSLTSCGNTIRGMGQDTANTVNATQDAGRRVEKAAQ